MKTGRKTRENVNRYPSGEIVKAEQAPRETEDQILSTVRMQRVRHLGATNDDYRDQKWAGPLGWMRQWSVQAKDESVGLSALQYDALVIYIKDRTRALSAQGFKAPYPRSIAMEMVASGYDPLVLVDEDEVLRLRRLHNGAKSRLLEWADGPLWVRLLEKLCSDDGKPAEWMRSIGDVRQAANVLVHYYQLAGQRSSCRYSQDQPKR
jgi:hypothetical protein